MFEASRATLEALELPAALELLAALTATDVGRRRAAELTPVASAEALERRRARYEEVRVLLVNGSLVSGLEGAVELLLERLQQPGALLDSADVLLAADLLRTAERATRRINTNDDSPRPALTALIAELPDSRQWTGRVSQILDRRGRVRDDASPALTKLRRQVVELRDGLYQDLQQVVSRYGSHLSEETIPLHEGRLVLLLKSGARGQVDGLVHGRSGTGRSFYFEPLTAVAGNNRLRGAIDDEGAERLRLLNELIETLREMAPQIRAVAEVIAELDLWQAAARLAETSSARLAEVAPPGELRLCAARHPLLDPTLAELRARVLGTAGHRGQMVPLDLELDAKRQLLVITGPNAGGKTVALKTAGLLTLLAQCGLPVAVDKGSRLPLLERLVATVGDEQDLLAERSTFSARLLRLREAWEAAGDGSLVLLDELGSGTDPDEGAALAVVLLEELHQRGTMTIVTTHLTRLAAMAMETDGASCAAMEFNTATGSPTFRLLPGSPGSSEALALAERLGLPAAWLARAAAELDPEQRRLQQLLVSVEETRRELAAGLDRVTSRERELEQAQEQSAQERAALDSERQKVARRLKIELTDFERRVRRRLSAAEERIRKELKAGRRKGVAAKAAAEVLAEPPVEIVASEPETGATGPLIVGASVRHRTLGWQGRLDRLSRGQAEVNVRGMRMRCREDDLVGVAETTGKSKPRRQPPATRGTATEAGSDTGTGETPELNLLGQRVEEALLEVDRYLDRALLGTDDTLRIVHGHGTGRLKRAVREHLQSHRAVAAQRAGGDGEGGDGATVVTLRD